MFLLELTFCFELVFSKLLFFGLLFLQSLFGFFGLFFDLLYFIFKSLFLVLVSLFLSLFELLSTFLLFFNGFKTLSFKSLALCLLLLGEVGHDLVFKLGVLQYFSLENLDGVINPLLELVTRSD